MEAHGPLPPRHIAIIMDGNGRWAQRRGLARLAGHRAGVESVRRVIQEAGRAGVEAVTLYAFSTENWRRPATEVQALLELFVRSLRGQLHRLHDNGVQLRFIGQRGNLPAGLQAEMATAEHVTAGNRGLKLAVAANYSGRWDILQAVQALAGRVARGEMAVDDLNEGTIGAHLALADWPPPDLLIRTGGEQRLSNFLLWQAAAAELYFTEVFWPDFDEQALHKALEAFRQRRPSAAAPLAEHAVAGIAKRAATGD